MSGTSFLFLPRATLWAKILRAFSPKKHYASFCHQDPFGTGFLLIMNIFLQNKSAIFYLNSFILNRLNTFPRPTILVSVRLYLGGCGVYFFSFFSAFSVSVYSLAFSKVREAQFAIFIRDSKSLSSYVFLE
jgi:hypothetical protein